MRIYRLYENIYDPNKIDNGMTLAKKNLSQGNPPSAREFLSLYCIKNLMTNN